MDGSVLRLGPVIVPAYIPSPGQGVWHVGPIPIRAYALCLIAGFLVAIWITDRRWQARGGKPGQIGDMAVWLVPAALVGSRIYHLITSPDAYFGAGGHPLDAFAVWKGGLGLWGGLIAGPLAGWAWCRKHDVDPIRILDCAAPAVPIAQAIGRWGNYFNQELYGGPTRLPWALRIDAAHAPNNVAGLFHPTFLYESVWNLLLVLPIVLWAERRFRLRDGRAFAQYHSIYTAGRAWIEEVRVDPAHTLFGLRVNFYVAAVVCVLAMVYVVRKRPRPDTIAPPADDDAAADGRSEDRADDVVDEGVVVETATTAPAPTLDA